MGAFKYLYIALVDQPWVSCQGGIGQWACGLFTAAFIRFASHATGSGLLVFLAVIADVRRLLLKELFRQRASGRWGRVG